MNSSNVLAKITGEFENISKIQSQFYQVYDCKLPANLLQEKLREITGNDELETEDPNVKLVYADDGTFLGQTKLTYETVQLDDFLKFIFLMFEKCGAQYDLNTLKFYHSACKRQAEFSVTRDILRFNNRLGHEETIKQFLTIITGFGGYQSNILGETTYRKVCKNISYGIRKNRIKLKHTVSNNQRLLEWCNQLTKLEKQLDFTKEFYIELDKVEVSTQKVNNFAKKLAEFGKNDSIETVSTRKNNIYNAIQESIAIEFARTGASAFGLLQGATYYTNHMASGSKLKNGGYNADYVKTMKGVETNDLAHTLVASMLN